MNNNTYMPNKLSVLSLAGCLLWTLAQASTVLAAPPITIRASVSSTGEEGNDYSANPVISANGRFVAFNSDASNLVEGDNNAYRDVFVRDLKTGVTQLVSLDSEGKGCACESFFPDISANGRFVTFRSDGIFAAEDNNGRTDVYVRDLKSGLTQLVSVNSEGTVGNNTSFGPVISANGRFIAFTSEASNLIAEDNNDTTDVFVHDLMKGTTQRVSVDSLGGEGNGQSYGPAISANGRFVVFLSSANNLVPGDNNGWIDVFVRDLKSGVTQRVSVSNAGAEGNSNSYGRLKIDPSGRLVTFASSASNLVAGDNNSADDVFVRDLKTGVTKRASVDSTGAESNGSSSSPVLSANGRFVAFISGASNLVTGDNNSASDIFVHDLKTGVTQRVSLNNEKMEGNFDSYSPSISNNGRFVAFDSGAGNLVAEDNNGSSDIFVRRLW